MSKRRLVITSFSRFAVLLAVLGILYLGMEQRKLAEKYFLEAVRLNPLLEEISFEKEKLKFKKNYKRNPFIEDYLEFVKAIKQGSAPNYKFILFNSLPEDKNISNETKIMFIRKHINLYWANPILGRSIFSSLIKDLNLNNENKLARELQTKADLLGFQYGWN